MGEHYFYFVITPEHKVYRVEIKNGRILELEELQQAVGGYIEIVCGLLYPIIGIVNEEGLLQGLDSNPIGSLALNYLDPLCGNVVIAQAEGEDIVGFNAKDADEIGRQICATRNLYAPYFLRNGGGNG